MTRANREEEESKEEDSQTPEIEKKYIDSKMYKEARDGNFTGLENWICQKLGGSIEEKALLDQLILKTSKGNNLVHLAVESGSKDFIQKILQKCPQLASMPNDCDDTPLHVAVRTGRFDIVMAILSETKGTANTDTPFTRMTKETEDGGMAGINNSLLRLKNKGGNTALHEALRNGDAKAGMYMWDKDKEMAGSVNESGESALYVAAEFGIESVVKKMVEFLRQHEAGVLPMALSGPDGESPSHAAALAGSIGCVKALIDLLEPNMINKPDKDGRTALHFAVKAKAKDIAASLLETDPSLAYTKDDISGRTPLLEAASSGHLGVLNVILEHCPDTVEISDNKGRTAVHLALECGTSHSKELLKVLELVRMVNEADQWGDTPLHVAAKNLNYRMVKRLLKIPEVDLRAKNKRGDTFLDICESEWQYTKKKEYLYRYLKSFPAGRKPHNWSHSANQLTPLDKPEADLKGHANALSVVAALLAAITFAAAFALPGGLTSDNNDAHAPQLPHLCNFTDPPDRPPPTKLCGPGHPIFADQLAFRVFILANVLAVSTSLTVLFILISAMLANDTALRKAIVYSKKLLNISLAGTMVTFMTGLYVVITTEVEWLAFAVLVIGSSVPFLINNLQVKSFTSTPVSLKRILSKKSSKKPGSSSWSETSGNELEPSDDEPKLKEFLIKKFTYAILFPNRLLRKNSSKKPENSSRIETSGNEYQSFDDEIKRKDVRLYLGPLSKRFSRRSER